jgi:hypothetical protein
MKITIVNHGDEVQPLEYQVGKKYDITRATNSGIEVTTLNNIVTCSGVSSHGNMQTFDALYLNSPAVKHGWSVGSPQELRSGKIFLVEG